MKSIDWQHKRLRRFLRGSNAKESYERDQTGIKNEILNDKFLMEELGDSSITAGKKRFHQLLERKLYWRNELKDIEIEVLRKFGYTLSNPRGKDKRLIVQNEKGYFEYVFGLLPDNENMQHLRDKEYIASLNRNISKIEYLVPNTQCRIDVVFRFKKFKLAVEIQNSTLEFSRLKDKIRLLEHCFDYWMLIIAEEYVTKYSYMNTKYGKILSKESAIQEINSILKKEE